MFQSETVAETQLTVLENFKRAFLKCATFNVTNSAAIVQSLKEEHIEYCTTLCSIILNFVNIRDPKVSKIYISTPSF